MATLETQILDDIIVKSRRKLLTLGGAALAGIVLGTAKEAHAATYSDADILNFALNLEYLEANFYYICAFGCTINTPNLAALAAGAPTGGIPINVGVGTPGVVTCSVTGPVPFATATAKAYALETAIEEGKHVLFLQTALGSSTQVAQPAINLDVATGGAWPTLVAAANKVTPTVTIPTAFSPYAASANDANFLIGAYVFEDVGVTAYHGAASLLTNAGNLSAAGGILAVEAYHAGLIRTTLNNIDPTGSVGLQGYTSSISALRAYLSNAATLGTATETVGGINYDTSPDDFGIANFSVSLEGTTGFNSTRLVDSDTSDTTAQNPLPLAIAFARNTNQVLNIVTGGGKAAAGATSFTTPAKGVFFPNGLNAGANGFV